MPPSYLQKPYSFSTISRKQQIIILFGNPTTCTISKERVSSYSRAASGALGSRHVAAMGPDQRVLPMMKWALSRDREKFFFFFHDRIRSTNNQLLYIKKCIRNACFLPDGPLSMLPTGVLPGKYPHSIIL